MPRRRAPDAEELARGYAELRAAEKQTRGKRIVYGRGHAKSFCVKMPSDLAVRLVALAAREGVSPQEVVRRLVQAAVGAGVAASPM